MKITEVNHSGLTFGCELVYDPSKSCKIRRDWGKHMGDAKKHEGIVYFIVVNGEIAKIGGSSNKIGGLVSQYLLNLESKAEPRENRFSLYLKILRHLVQGDKVEYYFIPVEDMTTYCEGLTGEMLTATHREFRIVESRLIEQFKIMNGHVPMWNNSEGSIGWDPEIIQLFDDREYSLKSGDRMIFNYDEFIFESLAAM